MSDRLTNEQIYLRQSIVDITRSFMRTRDVTESFYDKITQGTGACENMPTAYRLATDKFAVMSQTDQLQMEFDVANGIPSIYTLGRSYRNEPRTGDGRHLSEFTLLEFEARDMDLESLLSFAEAFLRQIIRESLESRHIPSNHKERLSKFLETGFKRVTYTEVIQALSDRGISINWRDDLSSRDEEAICVMYGGPVEVTYYPEKIKFFNMYRTQRDQEEETDTTTVDCVDFLLPWAGETFGGSRREESYLFMRKKLITSNMFKQMQELRKENGFEDSPEETLKPFEQYLNIFKDKTIMRSGFGLGMGV